MMNQILNVIKIQMNLSKSDEVDQNKIQEDTKHDISLYISEIKQNLNKVSKTNEKAFDLLAINLMSLLR